jgi:glycerol-3-phosphate acyltransferase PlsX
MRIVLDAMGGDYAPSEVVKGAVMAAREYGVEVVLVGREDIVRAELLQHDTTGLQLPIVHASQVIEMSEHPANAVREKADSSVVVGLKMVAKGEADAFVSAGHSGATVAAATMLYPGRIKAVKRPAMSMILPFARPVLGLDVGAWTEVKSEYLVQYAQMGSIYYGKLFNQARPRVALLSNGEEDNKGTALLQETHQLLKQLPGLNFIGNVESKEVLHGEADVVVMDGFTGNIFLKTVEATVSYFQSVLRESLTSSLTNKLLAAGLKPAFGKIRKRMDYEEYGGAPLLGIDGVVIITHGRMKAKGIKNSIRVGRDVAQNGTVEAIRTLLTAKPQPAATAAPEKDKEVVG